MVCILMLCQSDCFQTDGLPSDSLISIGDIGLIWAMVVLVRWVVLSTLPVLV
jgi:hypothetical protein